MYHVTLLVRVVLWVKEKIQGFHEVSSTLKGWIRVIPTINDKDYQFLTIEAENITRKQYDLELTPQKHPKQI